MKELRDLIGKIYSQLENDKVDAALMNCLRLARAIFDYLNAAVFLREMYPARRDFIRALLDDTEKLNDEAKKVLDNLSLERWLDTHQLDFSWAKNEDGEEKNVFTVSILEIDQEIQQWEQAAKDYSVPSGMTPFDTAAFTDEYSRRKAEIRLRIKALQTVKQRVKTRCLNYATMIERRLNAQEKTSKFLDQCQTDVNNYFKGNSDSVYEKLQKACQLVDSTSQEDHSLLLTQVRRSMKAVADYFLPASAEEQECSDGNKRILGEEQYLNRLDEFIARTFKKSTSRELLQSEYAHLSRFFRKLNEIASKGVHGLCLDMEKKTTNFLPKGFLTASDNFWQMLLRH